MSSASFSNYQLAVSFTGDSIGMGGIVRMTANVSNHTLTGTGEWSDGTSFVWSAARVAAFTAEPDTAKPQRFEPALFPMNSPFGAAFERPGRNAPSFEDWRDFMMRPDHFSPELWFLAYHRNELIGAALCYDCPQYGWVRQLGVVQPWRRRGLGSALLQNAFEEFYRRGHKHVALGVSSKNPNAYSFYEKIGMRSVRQYDEYLKDI